MDRVLIVDLVTNLMRLKALAVTDLYGVRGRKGRRKSVGHWISIAALGTGQIPGSQQMTHSQEGCSGQQSSFGKHKYFLYLVLGFVISE